MKKYKSICKKDYSEDSGKGYSLKTYLFKGVSYNIEEEDMNSGYLRRAMIPGDSYVGFLTIPFYDYFYTEAEIREMKLQEIGI